MSCCGGEGKGEAMNGEELVVIGGGMKQSADANGGGGVSRRNFLKILGTGAVAGVAGCADGQRQHVLPNVRGDYDQIPGVSVWYKSTCTECTAGCGISVRTREGRAIKIEGNPESPINQGGLCALGQSALQSLYDPDRVRQPLKRVQGGDASGRKTFSFEPISWADAYKTVADALKDPKGKKALITGELTGSLEALAQDFAQASNTTHVSYDPSQPLAMARASELVYGTYGIPSFKFDRSDVVLSFGAEFLETFVSPCEYARGWAKTRKSKKPTRVISVEPRLSLTGANADFWLSAAPGSEFALAALMIKLSIEAGRLNLSGALMEIAKKIAASVTLQGVVDASGISKEKLLLVARYLDEAAAPIVIAGGSTAQTENPLPLQIASALLNVGLGAVGKTVDLRQMRKPRSSPQALVELIASMRKGEISALFVHEANPAFALPSSFGYADARNFVPLVVSFSTHLDESAQIADLILPSHHSLESWGDMEPMAGVNGLIQPTMMPVFDTKSLGDTLLTLASQAGLKLSSGAKTFEGFLKERWQKRFEQRGAAALAQSFDQFWLQSVERGGVFAEVASLPSVAAAPNAGELGKISFAEALPATKEKSGHDDGHHGEDSHGAAYGHGGHGHGSGGGELKILPFMTVKSFDGRAANRPWLQELPDPMSTTSWDAWAEIHPETAEKFGLHKDDMVQIRTQYGEVNVGIYLTPYINKGLVGLPIGQGHTAYGRYARECTSSGNVMNLLPATEVKGADGIAMFGAVGEVRKGPGRAKMLILQGGDSQLGRGIGKTKFVKINSEGVAVKSDRPHEHEHGFDNPKQMYEQREHPLYQWGLNVDLAACTGCAACVVACYAENNIPVVGKDQVYKGREMSWLQIQRYFDGSTEDLHVSFVPMMCQHCQNAPCEPVCPVYATYHNDEGLNAMVYNRCVGTRYCGNNCSYKVRRFNWFEYTMPEPLNWQVNPDVTKRGLGVMEKCTFCVQRIVEAKDTAKDLGRLVMDGEVKPACVQSCPTQALSFGNLKDPNSEVSKKGRDGRAYKILDRMINTQPSVSYLSRIRLES
jgi:anaerobic selenocysteine-containing dehydrogenase/Fe-S-cluster-containing dehydrogenase component